ncbi:hypothetical protein [Neorhodopirellula lusitana]|uniref:hypothetical protein n=1 Tax=Neorhodopirellula lusitana TaxID=445327 RepID=UPI00384B210E
MIQEPHSNGDSALGSATATPFAPVPEQGLVRQIAFVPLDQGDEHSVLRFPAAVGRQAIVVPPGASNATDAAKAGKSHVDLTVLTIASGGHDQVIDRISDGAYPGNQHSGGGNGGYAVNGGNGGGVPMQAGQTDGATRQRETLKQMREWVEAELPPGSIPSLAMTFQGTQIFWAAGRLAIYAVPERLESVFKAMVEVSFYELELREMEQQLGASWSDLDEDIPLAFEVGERDLRMTEQLRSRFQQIVRLRARLARLSPQVHTPHVHPPTLASQVSERLRERTRMLHRYEQLDEQLSVFDQVYEMCGQRSSDFVQARKGHLLEWFIIILLVAQTLLYGFEFLTGMGQ